MNIKASRAARTGRQHFNDLVAAEAGVADHIAGIEDDNRRKAGHIAYLEHRLSKIQRNPFYRAGAAVHDLLTRPQGTS